MHNLSNEYSDVKVRVYSAGGGGINILSELWQTRIEPTHGFASILPCYIDTSVSNFGNKKILEEDAYVFEGIDGSGKVRATNYDDINKNIKAILVKFKPTLFNIVIHTGSGGSGSIIAPMIVSELKARGHQVVVFMLGSTDTRIEIENTIKTLKSYESIAEKRNNPVVVSYVENSKKQPRVVINQRIKRMVCHLLGLLSGQNDELDTADLKNWLEYTKITQSPARLASLNFAATATELNEVGTIVSLATLATQEMDTSIEATPAYQCVGYVPSVWKTGTPNSLSIIGDEPLHFTISDDYIASDSGRLIKLLKELDDVFNSRNTRESIIDKNDNRTDTGVIL